MTKILIERQVQIKSVSLSVQKVSSREMSQMSATLYQMYNFNAINNSDTQIPSVYIFRSPLLTGMPY